MQKPGIKLALQITLGIVLCLPNLPVQAINPPRPKEGQQACRSDVIAHCKNYAFTNRSKVRQCLTEHQSELSGACRDFLSRAAAFEAQLNASCGSDLQQYCRTYKGQPDPMRSCIKKNYSSFSSSCRQFLQQNR
ncbi:MAG: hypothetical protein KDK39_10340 [Leptospiraceae bacterium]|nr:hypothetical protein [Leptospiraceae bacterium]